MYVTSGNETEQLLTLEALVMVANVFVDADGPAAEGSEVELRETLTEAGFSRAAIAPEPALRRTSQRIRDLLPRFLSLPGSELDSTIMWVNAELTEISVSPSLSTHDDSDPHIHWTPPSATFDDQVLADFLMALANELCDNGTKRFGRCAADDCERLFYDSSRNGSRRFCSDPRCASRTHTADHRKRKRTS